MKKEDSDQTFPFYHVWDLSPPFSKTGGASSCFFFFFWQMEDGRGFTEVKS
jgi:hypothetical protein